MMVDNVIKNKSSFPPVLKGNLMNVMAGSVSGVGLISTSKVAPWMLCPL